MLPVVADLQSALIPMAAERFFSYKNVGFQKKISRFLGVMLPED